MQPAERPGTIAVVDWYSIEIVIGALTVLAVLATIAFHLASAAGGGLLTVARHVRARRRYRRRGPMTMEDHLAHPAPPPLVTAFEVALFALMAVVALASILVVVQWKTTGAVFAALLIGIAGFGALSVVGRDR